MPVQEVDRVQFYPSLKAVSVQGVGTVQFHLNPELRM